METVKLRGGSYFISDVPHESFSSGFNGRLICLDSFVAAGGEYLEGYDTVANGCSDSYACEPGDRVVKLSTGDARTFTRWEIRHTQLQ